MVESANPGAQPILFTTSSFGKADSSVLEPLLARGLEAVLNPYGRRLSEEEVSGLVAEVGPVGMVAGVEPLTAQVLAGASGLRVISRCGIGLDNVDLEAAKELGVRVYNTPDAPTTAVAELTIGLILTLLRSISASDRSIRRGDWSRPMGRLLSELTVGIVGCGRIGAAVAGVLKGFGCEVLGCDPALNGHPGMEMTDLEPLLARADIVTLHLPYHPNLHHLINSDRIAKMKRGAFLINASRGGLVDETALYEALKSGYLSGAALDCFESEPYNGPLTKCENVVLTAHVGSYAREARINMEREAINNLLRGLDEAGVHS